MSAALVTDNIARHFKENVAGIKGAYSSTAGSTTNVLPLPNGIPDTPIAVVYPLRYRLESTAPEKVRYFIDALVWFSEADPASTMKTYAPFFDLVRVSMRTNSTLYGSCTIAECVEGGNPVSVSVDNKPYVTLTFHFEAVEVNAIPTYT